MKNIDSYKAGIAAAKRGSHINNSWPYDYEKFRAGHRSVKSYEDTREDKAMYKLSKLAESLDL